MGDQRVTRTLAQRKHSAVVYSSTSTHPGRRKTASAHVLRVGTVYGYLSQPQGIFGPSISRHMSFIGAGGVLQSEETQRRRGRGDSLLENESRTRIPWQNTRVNRCLKKSKNKLIRTRKTGYFLEMCAVKPMGFSLQISLLMTGGADRMQSIVTRP